jgi:hypothetical protein
MVSAIGETFDGLAAAKEEVRRAWVADRPMALAFGQFKNRTALSDRNDIFDQFGFGLEFRLIRMQRSKSRVAANARPRNSHERAMRPRLALAWHRGRWALGAPGQTEPMHLSDHRIAGNTAKLRRNLGSRQSIAPELLEEFHAIVCPVHGSTVLGTRAAARQNPNPPAGQPKAAVGDALPQKQKTRTRCRTVRQRTLLYGVTRVQESPPGVVHTFDPCEGLNGPVIHNRWKEPRCLAPSALQSLRRARARVVDRSLARNTLYLVPPREAAHFVLPPKTYPPPQARKSWGCRPIIKTERRREFSPVTNLCASRPSL